MHDEHVDRTIELVQGQIRDLERALAEKKKIVNSLCGLIDRDPVYANVEPSAAGTVLRTDEFYNRPLASVVRTILERRALANLGAASIDAIYADMIRGGFLFDAKNDGTAKRSLATSLAKSTYLFHKLPNGDFGLTNWYNIPKAKANGGKEEKDAKEREQGEQKVDGLAEPYHNEFADSDGAEPDGAENSDARDGETAETPAAPAPTTDRKRTRKRHEPVNQQIDHPVEEGSALYTTGPAFKPRGIDAQQVASKVAGGGPNHPGVDRAR